jgi:DNA (cytosine-5)-methyltransferase 1
MGLDVGWVTDPAHDRTGNQRLATLGNGVLPSQAVAALRLLRGKSSPL